METKVTNTMNWIEHMGNPILFADYSDVDMLELHSEVSENQRAISDLGKRGNNKLLILTDVRNCHIDLNALSAFKSITDAMKPYTKGSAVVGVTGLRKNFLRVVNQFSSLETRAFDDMEEAKNWLVSLK